MEKNEQGMRRVKNTPLDQSSFNNGLLLGIRVFTPHATKINDYSQSYPDSKCFKPILRH